MNTSKSVYFNSLEGKIKERYLTKISDIKSCDPYSLDIKELSTNLDDFPLVHYLDIINYLKSARSPYTDEELRAIKSSSAFTFYSCGWVRDLGVKKFDNKTLIMGKVLHSQRLNQPPLTAWVICKPDGEIVSAHCNCTAGLGESCAHVGAILFAVEDAVRHYEPQSVTDTKAYWIPPSKKVGTQRAVEEIDFKSGKRKHEEIGEPGPSSLKASKGIPEPSEAEKGEFLRSLKTLPQPSAVLSVMAPYCLEMAEKMKEEESNYLTSLYKESHEDLTLQALQNLAMDFEITLSDTEIEKIEHETLESQTKWFNYRSGRITASIFKRACQTKIDNPSISLIKQICYPQRYSFHTSATRYGCAHEHQALNEYASNMRSSHTNFKIRKCGFIINKNFPQFGATPDSLVSCDCHGGGCVEVKCPYCIRDINLSEIREVRNLCLKKGEGNVLQLDKKHSYFYQIQAQMAVCNKPYCDFVVWTNKSIHIERVHFSLDFWQSINALASEFHTKVILPELLGKFFTKGRTLEKTSEDDVWCICKKEDDGTPMLQCDCENCDIMWYHLKCVNLTVVPESPWYCPTCILLQQ